jgi:hypothetical protein
MFSCFIQYVAEVYFSITKKWSTEVHFFSCNNDLQDAFITSHNIMKTAMPYLGNIFIHFWAHLARFFFSSDASKYGIKPNFQVFLRNRMSCLFWYPCDTGFLGKWKSGIFVNDKIDFMNVFASNHGVFSSKLTGINNLLVPIFEFMHPT